MVRIKKILTLLSIFFGIFILFSVSELIFIYNNRPQLIQKYYLFRSQIVVNKDLQEAIDFIVVGSDKYNKITINENNPYSEDFITTKPSFAQKTNLENDMQNYIKNPNLMPRLEDGYSYSRIIYDLALIAYKDNNPEVFVYLIQIISLNELGMSYWPVELANYYYSIGDQTKAFKILDDCQKIAKTKPHCIQIESSLKENNKAFEVGFLRTSVEDIYKHKSLDY